MSRGRYGAFHVVMAAGLGFAVTAIVALLVAQVSYLKIGDIQEALRCPGVSHAILLSFFSATVAALLALVLAVPSAYVLSRAKFPGLALLDALLDVPVLLSPVALGLALLLFFRSAAGQWIERHLTTFVFEVPGIIIAQFILALALEVRVLKTAFDDINPRLEHVSRCLGYSAAVTFRRVTLPLVRPAMVAAVLVGWCRAVGDFGATVMIAGAVPCKTETIPVAIYLNLASVRIERSVALAVVLTASALLGLVAVRLISKGHRA